MEKALKKHLPGGGFRDVSPARSKAMASVKSKGNKTTERRLRLGLVRARVRGWKLNVKGLKGRPDIFFPKTSLVVFTDGCYWHGCGKCGHFPNVNGKFWKTKILRNREHDAAVTGHLREEGYHVIRFWEHELSENLSECIDRIRQAIHLRIGE